MYSNGYLEYTDFQFGASPPSLEVLTSLGLESLTPYPTTGAWSMHATKDVIVMSTLEEAELIVVAGGRVLVDSTGDRSNVDVHADGNVVVKDTGAGSTLTVSAEFGMHHF